MPPKAPAPPPPPKLDFPSALEVLRAGLATPEQLDPALLPQALGYFHALSDAQLPQVTGAIGEGRMLHVGLPTPDAHNTCGTPDRYRKTWLSSSSS